MITREIIVKKLREQLPGVEFSDIEYKGDLNLLFDKQHIVEVCRFFKEDPEFQFIHCVDITAIDWAKREDRYTVVYHIFSLKNNFRLRLKCNVDESDLRIDSITSVWRSSDWYERETYDMYGITFNNHPDPRRMYMPEEFEYYPLRKDFPLMGIPGSLTLPKKN
jgi:NADH-quinone oxidoreductase subunit C